VTDEDLKRPEGNTIDRMLIMIMKITRLPPQKDLKLALTNWGTQA
jgi:hypothetical protein